MQHLPHVLVVEVFWLPGIAQRRLERALRYVAALGQEHQPAVLGPFDLAFAVGPDAGHRAQQRALAETRGAAQQPALAAAHLQRRNGGERRAIGSLQGQAEHCDGRDGRCGDMDAGRLRMDVLQRAQQVTQPVAECPPLGEGDVGLAEEGQAAADGGESAAHARHVAHRDGAGEVARHRRRRRQKLGGEGVAVGFARQDQFGVA
jgi:hypothetical protein